MPHADPAFETFRPAGGRFPASSLIKAFLLYFFPWEPRAFIYIYLFPFPFHSLALFIPAPPRLLPYFPGPASTSAGRAGRCPDSRRCLSLSGVDAAPGHAAFSLFPPLEGIPSLSSPFPCSGRGGRVDCCRFLATQGAPRSRSHGHLLISPRWVPAGDPAVPAALGHLRGRGSLGFQQGAGNGKSASRGLFPGREQAGWVGGVPGGISGEEGSWQGGEGVPAGRQGPGKPSPQPGSGAGFRKCFARR